MLKLSKENQQKLDQFVPVKEQVDFVNRAVEKALEELPKPVEQASLDLGLPGGGAFAVYSDGGARGNPGIAGCGAVIFDESKKKVVELKHFIPHATNNEAEYKALLLGVEKVLELQPEKVVFYLDSELIVKQMRGIYKVKKAELKVFYTEIKSLLKNIPQTKFIHIPREKNELADRLANEAMDAGGSL